MDWLNNIFASIYELGGSASVVNFSDALYQGKFYSHIGLYSIGLSITGVIVYYFIILGNKTKIFDQFETKLNLPGYWVIFTLILGLLGYFLMTMEADAYFLSIGAVPYDTQALTQLSIINAVFVMTLFYGFSFIRKVTSKYHQGKKTPH